MINRCIAFLLLLMAAKSVLAQKEADSSSHKTLVSVSFQPFFLMINATRFDVELQPEGKRYRFIISPEIYSGKTKDVNLFKNQIGVKWDDLAGVGIGLMHKFQRDEESGVYLAYGAIYRNQTIRFETEGFREFEKDGLTYYDYGPVNDKLHIQSVMVNGIFGYQASLNRFLIDYYLGLGYKKPFVKSRYPDAREYTQTPYLYTYNGFTLVAGVKLGLKIN